MAQKVILVDDLDNSEGSDVMRREFPLLDRTFAIDLSDGNQQRLCDALAFIERILERSREVKQATRSRKAVDTAPRLRGYTNTDVREWAREQGLEVSPAERSPTRSSTSSSPPIPTPCRRSRRPPARRARTEHRPNSEFGGGRRGAGPGAPSPLVPDA
ncbi:histone-like nucleoid-structuring protein Lsr2 [Streptosporangium lutulentum]